MRTERICRDPFVVLSDREIFQEYRLSKAVILELSSLLESDLKRKNKGRTLTVLERVLLSLKQLASGSFQNSSKDNINVSQSTVSRISSAFMDSLIAKKERFIYMPNSNHCKTTLLWIWTFFRGD